jgi:hypothetical protein
MNPARLWGTKPLFTIVRPKEQAFRKTDESFLDVSEVILGFRDSRNANPVALREKQAESIPKYPFFLTMQSIEIPAGSRPADTIHPQSDLKGCLSVIEILVWRME